MQSRRQVEENRRQAAHNRRQAAQEAENLNLVKRGARCLTAAEGELQKAMRNFQSVRLARGSTERREASYMLGKLEEALRAIRRAKRGSFIDVSDPDLAIDDPDLEG